MTGTTDNKPWEAENAPKDDPTPAEKAKAIKEAKTKAKAAADAENEAKAADDEPVDMEQHTLDVQIVMGKLAEQGVSPEILGERAREQDVNDSAPSVVMAFLEAELELTKPATATMHKQAPLALSNLVSRGMSMKDAKKKLGIK